MDTPPQPTNDKCLTWQLPVSEDGVIELPDDLIEATGWAPGTPIYWYPQDDGSIIISDQHKEMRTNFVSYLGNQELSNDWTAGYEQAILDLKYKMDQM
jgi:hypothetical protein